MRMASLFSLAAATGALLFTAGCGGSQHCPSSPQGWNGQEHGNQDRGDRGREWGNRDGDRDRDHEWDNHDRGDRDRRWGDRDDRSCGDRDRGDRDWGDRDWGDRGWGDRGWGDRGWGDRDRGGAPEVLEACNAKKAGDECVVKRGDWEMKGLCSTPRRAEDNTKLVCMPARFANPATSGTEAPKPPAAKPPVKPTR